MANIDGEDGHGGSGPMTAIQRMANLSGAVVSVALIVGLGIWGYKLLVRDVTGVPVIQAMEGAFRIAPEEPGGMTTPHQGLAVNEIAAEGGATGPVDTVSLAPPPADLAVEDRPAADLLAEAERAAAEAVADAAPEMADADVSSENIDDAPPAIETVAESGIVIDEVPTIASATDMAVAEALAGTTAPQSDAVLTRASLTSVMSPRPAPRPRGVARTQAAPVSARQPEVDADRVEIGVSALAPGTRLAQLGAYSNPEVARAEWDRIGAAFSDYFEGRRRVVQEVTSGGRTFYRLRAEGFVDLAEARRFCSALEAGEAECIPVELR